MLSKYKVTATFAALLIALSVYAVVLIVEGSEWTPFFDSQSSSVIFFSLVFLGVGFLLARRDVPDLETFSIALASTLSAIWFYELVFHYSFVGYLNNLRFPFFDFNDTHTLLFDGGISLLVFVGYKYARIRGNYIFAALFLAASLLYIVWLLIGFPQYDGTFALTVTIRVSDPFWLGHLLNRLSKLFLCLSWVTLYIQPMRRAR